MHNQLSPQESRIAIGALINTTDLLRELSSFVPQHLQAKTEATVGFITEVLASLKARGLVYEDSKPHGDTGGKKIPIMPVHRNIRRPHSTAEP